MQRLSVAVSAACSLLESIHASEAGGELWNWRNTTFRQSVQYCSTGLHLRHRTQVSCIRVATAQCPLSCFILPKNENVLI